jgi:hypothetical protein
MALTGTTLKALKPKDKTACLQMLQLIVER